MEFPFLLTLMQIVLLVLLLFVGLEIILRKKGATPFRKKEEDVKITSENSYYKEHPKLGFINQPGTYSLDINNRFQFTAIHDNNGHRISDNSLKDNSRNAEREIWIFGCSFTYGWLVQDNETFSWLIQKQLKDWNIRNFAVSGYSTLQSYLRLEEEIVKGNPPKHVLLVYGSSIHDKRNTLTRRQKKVWSAIDRTSGFRIPVARMKGQHLQYEYDAIRYRGIPFTTYSVLMNFIDNKINKHFDSNLNNKDIAKILFTKFESLCTRHSSTFIVVNINQAENTKEMLDYCNEQGILTVDISVDRSSKHPEHTFYPYDDHPSPLAHKIYAEKIVTYLKDQKQVV